MTMVTFMFQRTYTRDGETFLCATICPVRGPLEVVDRYDLSLVTCPGCLAALKRASEARDSDARPDQSHQDRPSASLAALAPVEAAPAERPRDDGQGQGQGQGQDHG